MFEIYWKSRGEREREWEREPINALGAPLSEVKRSRIGEPQRGVARAHQSGTMPSCSSRGMSCLSTKRWKRRSENCGTQKAAGVCRNLIWLAHTLASHVLYIRLHIQLHILYTYTYTRTVPSSSIYSWFTRIFASFQKFSYRLVQYCSLVKRIYSVLVHYVQYIKIVKIWLWAFEFIEKKSATECIFRAKIARKVIVYSFERIT